MTEPKLPPMPPLLEPFSTDDPSDDPPPMTPRHLRPCPFRGPSPLPPFVEGDGGRLSASIMLAAMSRSFSSISISPTATMAAPTPPPIFTQGPVDDAPASFWGRSLSSAPSDTISCPCSVGCCDVTSWPPTPPSGVLCTDISDASTDATNSRHRSWRGCRRSMSSMAGPGSDTDVDGEGGGGFGGCRSSALFEASASAKATSSSNKGARSLFITCAFGLGKESPSMGEDASRLRSSWWLPSRMGDRSFRFLELPAEALFVSQSLSCSTGEWGTMAEVSKLDVAEISSRLVEARVWGPVSSKIASMVPPPASTVSSEALLLQACTSAWQIMMTWPMYPLRKQVLGRGPSLLQPCSCCCWSCRCSKAEGSSSTVKSLDFSV
mmetsp:Transcript_9021/g.19526  ORF Transcript_9021/g.19526 Transcript_9021/m.19526 type:complete len:379 (-) Transcript_9021:2129-3265(-)